MYVDRYTCTYADAYAGVYADIYAGRKKEEFAVSTQQKLLFCFRTLATNTMLSIITTDTNKFSTKMTGKHCSGFSTYTTQTK